MQAGIKADDAPTYEDREKLEARRQELLAGLQVIRSTKETAWLITQLFAAYPMVKFSGDQAATAAAAYLSQLRDFPLWAIEAGCQSCIAKASPFPPSAGELRDACLRAVEPLAEEAAQLRKIVEAEIYTPIPPPQKRELSERGKAMMDEIHRTNEMLRAGKTPPPYVRGETKVPPHATPRSKYNVEDEQTKLNALLEKRRSEPLPQLSDEALALFNKQKPKPENETTFPAD